MLKKQNNFNKSKVIALLLASTCVLMTPELCQAAEQSGSVDMATLSDKPLINSVGEKKLNIVMAAL